MNFDDVRAAFECGEDPDDNFIEAFNRSDSRLLYLAQYVREEFLTDEAPDPHRAYQFILWCELHGADTFDLMAVFESGGKKFYIRHPARAIEWLQKNIAEGTWGIREIGLKSGVRHYRMALTDDDERLFANRWA